MKLAKRRRVACLLYNFIEGINSIKLVKVYWSLRRWREQ